MARADNTRFLTQATADRHQATLRKASDAIAYLDSSGHPVNFSAVAAAAGVSRASLYRDPDIRDLISRIRAAPSRSATTWGAPSLPDCGPPVRSIRKGLGVNGRQEKEFHS